MPRPEMGLTMKIALLCATLATLLASAAAEPVFTYDFEQGADFASYAGLKCSDSTPEIVAG